MFMYCLPVVSVWPIGLFNCDLYVHVLFASSVSLAIGLLNCDLYVRVLFANTNDYIKINEKSREFRFHPDVDP